MPAWLIEGWAAPSIAVAKAALMYLVALLGLRVAHRRTLTQWTAIDFAAAVAMGAIVGRTAIAGDQSFAVGAAALLAILVAHWIAAVGRFNPWFVKLVDHRVRVLVDHGVLRTDQLRLCGLTDSEVLAQLRQCIPVPVSTASSGDDRRLCQSRSSATPFQAETFRWVIGATAGLPRCCGGGEARVVQRVPASGCGGWRSGRCRRVCAVWAGR
jgi:hypothetical protein